MQGTAGSLHTAEQRAEWKAQKGEIVVYEGNKCVGQGDNQMTNVWPRHKGRVYIFTE